MLTIVMRGDSEPIPNRILLEIRVEMLTDLSRACKVFENERFYTIKLYTDCDLIKWLNIMNWLALNFLSQHPGPAQARSIVFYSPESIF